MKNRGAMQNKLLKTIHVLPLLLLSVLCIKLFLAGELTLYVHPRYVNFVVTTSIIGGMFALAFVVLIWTRKKLLRPKLNRSMLASIIVSALIAATLALAIALPPRPLSLELAERRLVEGGQTDGVCRSFVAGKYRSDFLQWSELISACNDPLYYRGQRVQIDGFVMRTEKSSDDNTLALGRVVVRCCAIDAQPIVLSVEKNEWEKTYAYDQWLRVVGSIQPIRVNGELTAVIVPDYIQPIGAPADPYVFY